MRSAPFAGITLLSRNARQGPAMSVRANRPPTQPTVSHHVGHRRFSPWRPAPPRQPPCRRPPFLPLAIVVAPVSDCHPARQHHSPSHWRALAALSSQPDVPRWRPSSLALARPTPDASSTDRDAIPTHPAKSGEKRCAPGCAPPFPFTTPRRASPPRAQRGSREPSACADDPNQGSLQRLPARAASAARPPRADRRPAAAGPDF
jgi:hypothetical protein